jgi:hypothetical protein
MYPFSLITTCYDLSQFDECLAIYVIFSSGLEKKKLSDSDPNPKHKYRKVIDIKKEKLLPTSLFY